ncbi:E4 [Gammapapillomavirus 13]|uniref:E4 n=1 Tax=Gammapapillomavirus 13 TaxID=1513258 RepID=A0A2D2ALV6_9PAPI|nr:E4 [Gammapapillomavirus 13]
MVNQEYGLYNTKIQLFPLLLPAPQNTPPPGTRASTPPTQGDTPHRRRVHPDDLKKLAREAADNRRQHLRWDDEDENKENQEPNGQPEEYPENGNDLHLPHLLKKWEDDINRFRERVFLDLEDLKKRLGIRHSS